MSEHQEKRRFIRMDLEDLPTVVTRKDGTSIDVLCKNLSGMGMLIASDAVFSMNEEVEAKIMTEKNELLVTAIVARQQPLDDGQTLYGLKIKTIK